jgi:YHS domain-containing protein
MRSVFTLTAAFALALCTVSGALAADKPAGDKAKAPAAKTTAANPKCPVCGMELSSKKTAKTPAVIKVNGKTYYCSAKCAAAAAKKPAAKAAPKKS